MWSENPPDKPGYYFFYGDPYFGAMGKDYEENAIPDKDLHIVKVIAVTNSLIFICDGAFMSKKKFNGESEGWIGVWSAIPMPELPT
jgi:hypothetical protein